MHLEFTANPLRLLAPCTGSVALLDSQQMIYISGRVVVIYNWTYQTQTFLPPRNSTLATSAFCLSPDCQVLATLEVGPKSNLVIYEMMPTRRRKAIPVHVGAQQHDEPVALAFSADGKLLATLLPEPTAPSGPVAASSLLNESLGSLNHAGSHGSCSVSYSITVYLWRTGKTLASISLGTTTTPTISPQISFNPMDVHSLNVVYSGSLRFYRLTPDGIETGLKPKLAGHVITCHAWISTSRMALGTKSGQILIVEEADVVTQIPLDSNDPRAARSLFNENKSEGGSSRKDTDSGQQIMAVCPLGLNQICHLTIQRLITINETKDSKGNIYHTSAVLSPSEPRSSPNQSADGSERAASIGSSRSSSAGSFEPGKCALAALARHGKRFVVVALRGQIWFAELTSQLSSEADPGKMENIISLAHSGEIRGLSTAVWRPHAVTVGQDRRLFLWNLATEQIQFRKHLDEDILCASLHPMGHYVAITTSDSLQIFSVLVDRFHLVREVILAGCRKVAFNSGGNWIAVTRGSSLQLINFITFETSSPLMAHKADINQIVWSEDGQRIYSCGADGLLCEWDSVNHDVKMQVKPNGNSLVDLAALSNGHLVVASIDGEVVEVGSDGNVVCRLRGSELSATSLLYLRKEQVILVGTRTGGVRAYKYPINSRSEYQEHFTQYGSITQMSETSLGLDGQMLMTCCDDGSICLWRLGDDAKQRLAAVSAAAAAAASSSSKLRMEENELNMECLVLRTDWNNRGMMLDNAVRQLQEVKRQAELQIKAVEQDCAQKTYASESRHHDQVDRAVEKIQELEKKLAEQIEQSHQQVVQLRLDSDAERRRLEESHHSKLAAEYRHHQNLENQIEQLKQHHIREMDQMEARLLVDRGQFESHLRDGFDISLKTLEEEKVQLRKKVAGLEAALKLTAEKFETDQKAFQSRHEGQLSAEKQVNLKLRGETAILKKSVNELQKEVETLRLGQLTQQSESQRLLSALSSAQRETKDLQDELERRDAIIRTKDDKLQKLVQQMQQHDTKQIELRHQHAEAKRKLVDSQAEIVKLQCKLQEAVSNHKSAQTEVEHFRRANEQIQGKAKSQLGELQGIRHKFQSQQSRLQEILVCLDVGMSYLHDPKQLKEYFAAIHDVYCEKEHQGSLRSASVTSSVGSQSGNNGALLKKVESLENTIASLRHQLSETIKLSEIKQEKLRKDNNLLLNELESTKKQYSSTTNHK